MGRVVHATPKYFASRRFASALTTAAVRQIEQAAQALREELDRRGAAADKAFFGTSSVPWSRSASCWTISRGRSGTRRQFPSINLEKAFEPRLDTARRSRRQILNSMPKNTA
jgi:hypothetical protein